MNELAVARAEGLAASEAVPVLARILAIDPPSVASLRPADGQGFTALARELQRILTDLDGQEVDAAAARLNALLANHPAHPHLAKEDGRWRLHHHPAEAPLVPMWTAICAEALASMIGADRADRLGLCERPGCGRAYVDLTKNASRRFCSNACQNRVKVAAFRERRGTRKVYSR